MKEKYTEKKLLADIRFGGSKLDTALRSLYNDLYGFLENYVIKNSGDADDAADVIQDSFLVFINMVQNNKFREESSIKSILYSICRNLWITEIRKRKSTMARNEQYESEKEVSMEDINDSLIRQEEHRLIMGLFETLGLKCKNILLAFYFENLSMKEIMIKEEFSNEQVLRNKKHKCLKTLIEKVESDTKIYKSLKIALQNGK